MTVRHPQFGLMCEICYTGLSPRECARDTDGVTWDVCKGACAIQADIREDLGLTDDGRRWWVVGAQTWTGVQIYPASGARNALAAYRRDLVAADQANGFSRLYALRIVRAADLHVVAGPLTTPTAFEYDFASALAGEVTRWSTDVMAVPVGPISREDMGRVLRRLGGDKVAQIRTAVLTGYRLPCTCCGRKVGPLDDDQRCGHCGANRAAGTHVGDQPCRAMHR